MSDTPVGGDRDAVAEAEARFRQQTSDRQDDLAALLRALGMGDHARPMSPKAVFKEALGEAARLRSRVKELEAALNVERIAGRASELASESIWGLFEPSSYDDARVEDQLSEDISKAVYDAVVSAVEEHAADHWNPIATAPKDGTAILAWCVHPHARWATDDKDWAAPVVTQWINHNGGGWTWNGMAGTFTHWMPLPPAPEVPRA